MSLRDVIKTTETYVAQVTGMGDGKDARPYVNGVRRRLEDLRESVSSNPQALEALIDRSASTDIQAFQAYLPAAYKGLSTSPNM